MSNKKMKLWDSVMTSDPASVKEVSFGRKFNAINAQHQIKRATEVFGPIGKGWGVTAEQFTALAPGLILYQAMLWYLDDDHAEGKQPNMFGISASIATHSNAGKLDDECVKKVSTDALTKGLSKLGFNADIFLGMWDDNKYVNTVKAEKVKVDTESAQEKIALKLKALEEQAANVRKAAAQLSKDGNPEDIQGLWKDNPQLHSIKGFKAAMTKYGKTAKANKEKLAQKDEGNGEG